MLLSYGSGSEKLQQDYLSYVPAGVEAPWYHGIFSGAAMGVEHAFDVAEVAYLSDESRRDKAIAGVVESRPDPIRVGTAGQVLHGFTSTLTYGAIGALKGAAVGGGVGAAAGAVTGPGALATAGVGAIAGAKVGAATEIGFLSGYDRFLEQLSQGVDPSTAIKSAGITASVMTVGAMAPAFIGTKLSTQVASGVGMNVGLGGIERGATGAILENAGYDKVAEHYKIMDAKAVALDALLGAIFPLGARAMNIGAKSEHIDSALTEQQYIDAQRRNPGLETSMEGVETFHRNLAEADRQILGEERRGADIDLPRFDNQVPNPAFDEFSAMVTRTFDDHIAREFGVTREAIEADLNRSIDLSRNVSEMVQRQLDEANAESRPIITAEEVTAAQFSQLEAEGIAAMNPRSTVTASDGRIMEAADFIEYTKEIVKKGNEDSYLHNVAISCYLTHGE